MEAEVSRCSTAFSVVYESTDWPDEELRRDFDELLADERIHVAFAIDHIRFVLELRESLYDESEQNKSFCNLKDAAKAYVDALEKRGVYQRYMDSDVMNFDGDIIITDPCYICKDDDWGECDFGENMETLGLRTYMARDTLYGDWSCTAYNSDTNEVLGEFCADAGMVGVFLLNEVQEYNPEFDWHLTKPHTATLIKNFRGTVQFVVKEYAGTYEEDTKWWKKGDQYTDYYVEVVGYGINNATGEPLNFVTRQTGF